MPVQGLAFQLVAELQGLFLGRSQLHPFSAQGLSSVTCSQRPSLSWECQETELTENALYFLMKTSPAVPAKNHQSILVYAKWDFQCADIYSPEETSVA